jgi:membrane protein required for colicin V production
MAGLSGFDIIILLLLAGGAVTGFMRGFVQEILSLAALIAALAVLRLFHAPFSLWLSEAVGTETGAAVLAFSLILGIVWGGGKYLARRIGAGSRTSVIGPFDRVLGAGFGLCKGLLTASLGFMLFTLVYDVAFGATAERPAWLTDSRTYPLMRASSAAVSAVLASRIDAREDARTGAGSANAPANEDERGAIP